MFIKFACICIVDTFVVVICPDCAPGRYTIQNKMWILSQGIVLFQVPIPLMAQETLLQQFGWGSLLTHHITPISN